MAEILNFTFIMFEHEQIEASDRYCLLCAFLKSTSILTLMVITVLIITMMIKKNYWDILRQWIALKSRSDWPLKFCISFLIHLSATRAGFAPEIIVVIARINECSFCAILTHCFSIY